MSSERTLHIAHLASYFETSQLYKLLVKHLANYPDIRQTVFSSRGFSEQHESTNYIKYRGADLTKRLDRLFFRRKVARYERHIQISLSGSIPDIIHAHSLYSDGIAAFRIGRRLGIPFVVTVRSTDVNTFARLRPDLNQHARQTLHNAGRIVFVNHVHRAQLEARLGTVIDDKRVVIIPNGVDKFWIDECLPIKPSRKALVRLVSVSKVTRRKNHSVVIDAVKRLNAKASRYHYQLTIVGDFNSRFGQQLARTHSSADIRFLGAKSAPEIREQFSHSDIFVLLSLTETFGIAYVEALSQGLPIVFSRDRGFDGWDTGGIPGIACEPTDVTELMNILESLNQRPAIDVVAIQRVRDRYRWDVVAAEFRQVYTRLAMHRS